MDIADLSTGNVPWNEMSVTMNRPSQPENPAAALQQRFLLALVAIGGLLVCHQLVIQPALGRLATDAPVINVAGRQRMLSQRLAKTALAVERASVAGETLTDLPAWEELQEVRDLWTRSHRALQLGDPALNLPPTTSPEVQSAFEAIEPDFQAIAQAVQTLLAIPTTELTSKGQLRAQISQSVQTILDHEASFVSGMHHIVTLYESEARERVYSLQRLGWVIMLLVLGTLGVVYLLAIHPAVRLLARKFQQREERFRTLVDSMHDGLLVTDQRGWIEFVNPRLCEMVGRSAEELVGIPVSRLLTVPEITTDGAGPTEQTLQPAGGQPVEVLVSARPVPETSIHSADTQRTGLLFVVVDITSLKQSQRETRQLTQQLTHANRLKTVGAMAAGIAHEINQPLGAIANFAEGALTLLQQAEPDQPLVEQGLKRILQAARRCAGVIHHVRDFSRQQTHTRTPTDINQLLRDVEELCLPDLKRERVQFITACAESLPLVPLDVIQVQQILINLIQNAVQAQLPSLGQSPQPDRPRWVRITSHLGAGEVILEVLDNGPGISVPDPDTLFDPFVTTKADGLGLGLSIVKSLITAHEGWITVANSETAGACFRMGFPLSFRGGEAVLEHSQPEEAAVGR